AQDPALDLRTRPAPAVLPGKPRGLVGREGELGLVTEALERARGGHLGVVLVSGEPGIGKSRLADASAAVSAGRGMQVLVGRCWEAGEAPPYWPWLQALRSLIRDAGGGTTREWGAGVSTELATILPELGAPASASDRALAPGARFRLFEAVATVL